MSQWKVRGGAMQEDGLHGVDGYDVWRGDERADDSFFQDGDDAQEMADRLNEEDRWDARLDGTWLWLYMPCHDHILHWDYAPFGDADEWKHGGRDAIAELFPIRLLN